MIQRNFTRPSIAWALLVALACAWCIATPARAQGGDLDPAIVQAPQLTPDQKAKVAEFVKANSPGLAGTAQDIKKSRSIFLRQIESDQTGAAFRLEYSAQLEPVLRPLLTNANEMVVINALVIAADLATQKSSDLLIEAAASPKPAVRYQVAYGLRRTFEALAPMQSPTMLADQIQKAIDFVGTRLEAEGDPLVIDCLILAGLEGAKLPSYRARALATVCGSVAKRVKALKPSEGSDAMLDAMLRSGSGVRDALTSTGDAQIDQATLKNVADLGGQLVAFCVRTVEAQTAGADKAKLAQIAGVGETVALLALERQLGRGRAPAAKGFSEKLRTSEAQFLVDAKDLLGAGGPLTAEPFKFSAAEFPLK